MKDICTFCGSNEWDTTSDNHRVYWKDSDSGIIHVGCYMYIDKNPKDMKVRVWHWKMLEGRTDWKKSEPTTKEDILKDFKLTKEDLEKYPLYFNKL